jgi:hypothetical protein
MIDVFEKRDHCPSCNAETADAVPAVASRPPAESLTSSQLGPFLSGYTLHRVFFTYHRCGRCNTLYCPMYFNEEHLSRLYRNQPENMAEAPFEARAKTQEHYFQILQRYSRMRGGYLELGTDLGVFVDLCVRAGGFDHYWLYEPNEAVHGALATQLGGQPYTLRRFYAPGDVPEGSVSTAVMIHVLDHVLNPGQLLRAILKTLEPGGVLFMVTHDAESVLARTFGRRWPPYTLQHPQLFGRRSIRRLMDDVGFNGVEVVKTLNHFPLSHLAKALCSVFGLRAGFIPDLTSPMLGIRLGNIATIARRPA